MILVWLVFAAMTLATAVLLALPLFYTRKVKNEAVFALAVYRDQMQELNRDAEAGLIGAAEAKSAQIEIERRILALTESPQWQPGRAPSHGMLITAAVVLPLLGFGLYLKLGEPALPGQPFSATAAATAPVSAELAALEAEVHARPTDARAWTALAAGYDAAGRAKNAATAYGKAVALGAQDGTTLGTPLYMSPEQAEGRAIDTRSDLYSLGATLYHLLAGRPPFGGSTSVAVALAHLHEAPRSLDQHRDDLPPILTTIVLRLLAKSPADRYQSPTELLHAVELAEEELFPGFPRQKSPLAWSDGGSPADGRFRTGVEDFRERSSHDGTRSRGWRAHATTNEVRTATLRLQSAMERERYEADASRRAWMTLAMATAVALGVGFALGRTPPRRSRLFRLPFR